MGHTVHNVTVHVSVACVEVAQRPSPWKLIASMYSFTTYTIKISYHLFKVHLAAKVFIGNIKSRYDF